MKVIGLISGGKDSIFNCMLCTQQGHQIVAFANLTPPPSIEELDSYMYQTVGNALIQSISQCWRSESNPIPLFQLQITGKPLSTTSNTYSPTEEDEVEDLFTLLSQVLSQVPGAEAVAVGAILSNYQRLRVENVCSRLGIVCLAFLWQQDQHKLLDSMIESGVEAVLVKVAAMGLHTGMLGKGIGQVRGELLHLASLHGLNVCGEGGEYESMVLDCPAFDRRIVLDEWEVVEVEESEWAPVAFLHPKAWHLEAKGAGGSGGTSASYRPSEIHTAVDRPGATATTTKIASTSASSSTNAHPTSPSLTNPLDIPFPFTASSEWKDSISQKDREEAAFIMIILPDMHKYSEFNTHYATMFPSVNPPARACVQVKGVGGGGKPLYKVIKFPITFHLHVQSISFWAPANIGPYSQLVENSEQGFTMLSGLLGFYPEKMQLAESANEQFGLILSHVNALNLKRRVFDFWVVFFVAECLDWVPEWHERIREEFCLGAEIVSVVVDGLPRGALVEVVCWCGGGAV